MPESEEEEAVVLTTYLTMTCSRLNHYTMTNKKYTDKELNDEFLRAGLSKTKFCKEYCVGRLRLNRALANNVEKQSVVLDRDQVFSLRYDKGYIIPQKVREVIETWLSRPDVKWAEDVDMQRQCGITNSYDWKTYARESSLFDDYLVSLPDKKYVWAYSPEYAEELQQKVLRR